jgi:hypothetical protein
MACLWRSTAPAATARSGWRCHDNAVCSTWWWLFISLNTYGGLWRGRWR